MTGQQASQPDLVDLIDAAYRTWVCLICGLTYDEQAGGLKRGLHRVRGGRMSLMNGFVRIVESQSPASR